MNLEILKTKIAQHNTTRAAVARDFNISRQQIDSWYHGRHKMGMAWKILLDHYFDIKKAPQIKIDNE